MNRTFATEISPSDAAWLRGQGIPDGVEIAEVEEVQFMGRVYEESSSGLLLPQQEDPVERLRRKYSDEHQETLTGMDLFSGCGGFSLGLHMAGFDVVAAAEWDISAAVTYLMNLGHPECQVKFGTEKDRVKWEEYKHESEDWIGTGYRQGRIKGGCRGFYLGDIRKITGQELLDLAGVDRVNVVFGGPPCQGLSASNAKRCIEDPRNAMLWEFMRIVEEILPDAFIIENVPPLLTIANGALGEALGARGANAGYTVVADILDAVGYGVPQHRRRALIVGRKGDVPFQFPMPSHWSAGWSPDGDRWRQGFYGKKRDREVAAATFDSDTGTWSAPTSQPESHDDEVQVGIEFNA